MPQKNRPVTRFLDALCHGIALSVGVAVLLTVAVVSYGVLAREVLKLSDVWVTEVTTYLMAYMTFVGTATLAWQGRHLKVDVLGQHVGPRTGRALSMLSCAIVTAVALTLFWLGWNFWLDAWTSGEKSWGMFSIPLWIPYSCLLVGSALLAVVQAVRFVKMVLALLHAGGELPEDEGARAVVRH
jgi:TRAP-type C4-dicarboxylate transport system permease small subunit